MGKPWRNHPSWELVEECSEILGRDLQHLLIKADTEELADTANTQIATVVVSMVALDAVERLGISPTISAGHSLGEYTALIATGALSIEEGTKLVCERAQAMKDAVDKREGKMMALIGIGDDDAEASCCRAEGDVWVANYNSPNQIVIAGDPRAVDKAIEIAKASGAKKALPMQVKGGFHTPFMIPARQRLKKALSEVSFSVPEVPVVANIDARIHQDPSIWPNLLSSQLCSPVRWHQSLHTMWEYGSRIFVEIGPGEVLSGLCKRTIPAAKTVSINGPDSLDELVNILATKTAQSWTKAAARHAGEHTYIYERLIVSPSAGVFYPTEEVEEGLKTTHLPTDIQVGDLIGTTESTAGKLEIRSSFEGMLVDILVLPGERVTQGQPVAWLRTKKVPESRPKISGSV